jgi:hypothetical protein
MVISGVSKIFLHLAPKRVFHQIAFLDEQYESE